MVLWVEGGTDREAAAALAALDNAKMLQGALRDERPLLRLAAATAMAARGDRTGWEALRSDRCRTIRERAVARLAE
jgi:hypothetical protein